MYLFRESENSTTKPLKYCGTDFSDVLLNKTQKTPKPFKVYNTLLLSPVQNVPYKFKLTISSSYMQQLLKCLLRACSCYHSYDKNFCDTSMFGAHKWSGNLASSFHSCTNTMFSSCETFFTSVKSFQQPAKLA